MPELNFQLPPRTYPVRLSFALSEDTRNKLAVIAYANDVSMTEVVEMLFQAAIPVYFEQNPVIQEKSESYLLEAIGERRRKCQNASCPDQFTLHKVSDMIKEGNWLFCSEDCLNYFKKQNPELDLEPIFPRRQSFAKDAVVILASRIKLLNMKEDSTTIRVMLWRSRQSKHIKN